MMINRFLSPFGIILFLTIKLSAQMMTPEQVVQKQLDAYNQRNIDQFMSTMDPEVVFYNFANGERTMEGAAACKAYYADLFENSPKLHSNILNRTVFGNKVIDHESIIGRNGSAEVVELVLIYQVDLAKITKVTVLRKHD
ncbi:MAG: steroid delta-isomerase [Flavobacteriales bacterium]|nr:MAG: steroid delta-isomerase [Flavobacteriales bacterium]